MHAPMLFCDIRKNCMVIRLLDEIPAGWMVWNIQEGYWGGPEGAFGHSVWTLEREKRPSGGKMHAVG